MKHVLLTKKYTLSALHRHHNPELSAKENENLYRKCSRVHGHEYKIEVTLRGTLDAKTGLAADRSTMDRIVQKTLLAPLSGGFLNDHVGNTSGEIIVEKFFQILQGALPPGQLVRVRVRETRKNSFSSSFNLARDHVAI